MLTICVGVIGGSNTLTDPYRSTIGGSGRDPCGVDAYADWPFSVNRLQTG